MLSKYIDILIASLPFLFAWGAMTLYGILSQSRWSNTTEEIVADSFVVLASLGCAFSTASMTGNLAVILAPLAMIGTYYFAKESALLKHWSLILQQGFLVIQDGKIYLFGVQVPPHAQTTFPETPVAPLNSAGQATQPIVQAEASQGNSTRD